MKKLTAGIFATLLAVVSTGAANAEIASKGYVDEKDAERVAVQQETNNGILTTSATGAVQVSSSIPQARVDGLGAALAGKADAANLDAKLDANAAITAGTGTKITYDAKGLVTGSSNLTAADIPALTTDKITGLDTELASKASQTDLTALTGRVTTAEGDIDALQAPTAQVAEGVTGPVSGGTVFNAIEGVTGNVTGVTGRVGTLEDEMDTAQSDITKLQTGKQDKLTGPVGSATQPVYVNAEGNVVAGTAYGSLATKSTVTSADITDGTIAEGDLNASINASLDKADTALQKATADAAYAVKSTEGVASTASTNAQKALTDIGTKSELTTTNKDNLVGAINELDAAMEGMATNDTIEGIQTDLSELEGKVNTNTTNIGTNTTHIGTVGNLSTTAKTDLVSAVNEVKTQADKGVSDAAAAKSTADSALTKANAAIPAPDGECADPANKCVLTYNNTAYAWEVIERGSAE